MRKRWIPLFGVLVFGCTQDFEAFDTSGSAGSGASATGGSGGSSSGGLGGATGGTGGATGGAAGTVGTGGATGGAGGATGGTGGATGGTGGATGGTGGATGGTGGATGGTGGTGGVPTCEKIYSGMTGVNAVCVDSDSVCEMNFASKTATCAEICGAGGGECTGVFDNQGPCGHTGPELQCTTTALNGGICVCTHGCGSGPPCTAPQTCKSGTCSS